MLHFHLAEHGTTVRTEIIAGITTFLSMVYILAVYPSVMGEIGIPAFATATALIMVAFLMIAQIAHINFNDLTEAIPCLVAIIVMPFSYNIADGIGFGFIAWTGVNLLCGHRERLNPILIGASILFLAKYPFL